MLNKREHSEIEEAIKARINKIESLPAEKYDEKAWLTYALGEFLKNNNAVGLAMPFYFRFLIDAQKILNSSQQKPLIEKFGHALQSVLITIINVDQKTPDILNDFNDICLLKQTEFALAALPLNSEITPFLPIIEKEDYGKLQYKVSAVSLALEQSEVQEEKTLSRFKVEEESDVKPIEINKKEQKESTLSSSYSYSYSYSFLTQKPSWPVIGVIVGTIGWGMYTTGIAVPLFIAAMGGVAGYAIEKTSDYCLRKTSP